MKSIADALYDGNVSELARRLEMKPQALRKYVTGESMPGGLVLIRLHDIGVNINWFLTGTEQMFQQAHPARISEPMEQYLALLESDELSKEEQHILDELLKFSNALEELDISGPLRRALLLVYAKHVNSDKEE